MLALPSNRLFFILVALVVIGLFLFKHPYFKSQLLQPYRAQLFATFLEKLKKDEFDPEYYWEFRERFSPGTFLRDEDNTDFFATFKIVATQEELTPLLYYESKYLRSLDALTTVSPAEVLESTKKEFTGEVILENENFVLTKESESEYIFVFLATTEKMKRVNGMFDYLPEEQELLDNKLWYNATYLKVQ